MRLITKITLLNLVLAMFVFIVGGWIIYTTVKQVVTQETDYELRAELKLITKSIEQGLPLEALTNRNVSIEKGAPAPQLPADKDYFITDTLLQPRYLDRLEPFRKLVAYREINGTPYLINISRVFIETNDLEGVQWALFRLFIFLSIAMVLFSIVLSKWLFKPFKEILTGISQFQLKSGDHLPLPLTTTHEFRELNHFLEEMTQKARKDYLSLKEFSENASHEMQTPIAVAKGKLEILQETPDLKPQHLKLIQSAQESLTKLSKLEHALSLLTKIDNKEFASKKVIDFTSIVKQSVDNFRELAAMKGLAFESQLVPRLNLKLDPNLADILIGNLLKNAIRHNTHNGWINVELTHQYLLVSNTGAEPKVPTRQLFNRFRKSRQGENSLGLGLAIVKKICDVSGFKVNYHFSQGIHQLRVKLKN